MGVCWRLTVAKRPLLQLPPGCLCATVKSSRVGVKPGRWPVECPERWRRMPWSWSEPGSGHCPTCCVRRPTEPIRGSSWIGSWLGTCVKRRRTSPGLRVPAKSFSSRTEHLTRRASESCSPIWHAAIERSPAMGPVGFMKGRSPSKRDVGWPNTVEFCRRRISATIGRASVRRFRRLIETTRSWASRPPAPAACMWDRF